MSASSDMFVIVRDINGELQPVPPLISWIILNRYWCDLTRPQQAAICQLITDPATARVHPTVRTNLTQRRYLHPDGTLTPSASPSTRSDAPMPSG